MKAVKGLSLAATRSPSSGSGSHWVLRLAASSVNRVSHCHDSSASSREASVSRHLVRTLNV